MKLEMASSSVVIMGVLASPCMSTSRPRASTTRAVQLAAVFSFMQRLAERAFLATARLPRGHAFLRHTGRS